jgi:hypothetical protein
LTVTLPASKAVSLRLLLVSASARSRIAIISPWGWLEVPRVGVRRGAEIRALATRSPAVGRPGHVPPRGVRRAPQQVPGCPRRSAVEGGKKRGGGATRARQHREWQRDHKWLKASAVLPVSSVLSTRPVGPHVGIHRTNLKIVLLGRKVGVCRRRAQVDQQRQLNPNNDPTRPGDPRPGVAACGGLRRRLTSHASRPPCPPRPARPVLRLRRGRGRSALSLGGARAALDSARALDGGDARTHGGAGRRRRNGGRAHGCCALEDWKTRAQRRRLGYWRLRTPCMRRVPVSSVDLRWRRRVLNRVYTALDRRGTAQLTA